MLIGRMTAGLLSLAAIAAPTAHAELVVDGSGLIRAVLADGEYVPAMLDIWIPAEGWSSRATLGDLEERDVERHGQGGSWTGVLRSGGGRYSVNLTISEAPDGAHWIATVECLEPGNVEGVHLALVLPTGAFGGGTVAAPGQDEAVMPARAPAEPHFYTARTASLSHTDSAGDTQVRIETDRELPFTVQDTRVWGSADYNSFAKIHAGDLASGEVVAVEVALRVVNEGDRSPATVEVDFGEELFAIDGFGGNYCFQTHSPVTDFTLERLNVRWIRTEASLDLWEPINDNDDPGETSWGALRENLANDAELERDFEMARKAAERALPWIISAWHPPGWMCADPAQDRWAHAREVPRENWPELIENVTSYLLAVREYAGREPDIFSFNEPDYGVMLHLTAEDHRDLTIALGRAFEAAGLSTKLLLGDVTNPRGTHTYCQPTAEDPQARQYLAAVGFHSWGGASADDYRAWRDLAESLELPLLVTEFGVDAAAWRTRSYDTYYYAMQEVGMMQDILTHARPRSTMQWELTADYSIVDEVAGQLVPGTRMRMLAHYYNLAPTPSRGVSAVSSHEAVRATAFVDENGAWSVHLTNHGAGREVTIGGLPPGQAVLARIDDSEGTRDIEDRPSPEGRLTVALPAQCICTVRGG